ncbi:MAG: DMT family transporter, partial [Fibrobacterota bacterium]
PFAFRHTSPVRAFRTHYQLILAVAASQVFLLYLFFYLGIERIPASLAAVFVGFSPMAASLVAHFLQPGDRLTPRRLSAYLLGVCGVVMISAGEARSNGIYDDSLPLGILLFSISIVSSAFATNLIASKKNSTISPFVLNSFQLTLGGLMLFAASGLYKNGIDISGEPLYLLSLLYLASLSAGAFSIWFYLLKHPDTTVSALNIWKFVIPLSGAVLSWTFLADESPTPAAAAGVLLVVISLIVFNRR